MNNDSPSESNANYLDEYLEKSKDLFPSLSFLDFLDPIEPYFSKGSKQQYVALLWLLRILFYSILVGCFWLIFFEEKYLFLHQLSINILAGMIAFLCAKPIAGGLRKWGMAFLLVPGILITTLLYLSNALQGPLSEILQNLACDLCLVAALDVLFRRFIDTVKDKFSKRL